jgi:hypothetical protein
MGEDAEFRGYRFGFRLAWHGDDEGRGPEWIVDADGMVAEPQMQSVVERHGQYVITEIGILFDRDLRRVQKDPPYF